MTTKPRLILSFPISADVVHEASKNFDLLGLVPQASVPRMSCEEIVALALKTQPDAILVSPFHQVDESVLARLPSSIKIIATCSVGFEHLDLRGARARGIMMTNTPDVLTDGTADAAMMLLLCASRRAREHAAVVDRGWGRALGQDELLGLEVSGKNLGIIGMGRIGRALAQRARGFNMKIHYSNRTRLAPELEQGAQFYPDFRAMLPHCQVLSLHAPATPETQNMMNAASFALLPRGAVFVNTARGSLVDEEALLEALRSGQLFAAGLDVYKNEPRIDPRFLTLTNVFLTPHAASATRETRNAMGFRALENIRLALSGRTPVDLL
jgi:hydroxypyruvate reductase